MVELFDANAMSVGTYATIHEAVSAAADGYTVVVSGGTYVEQVVVDNIDNLTIRAADGESVTIQAPASDLVVTATGPAPNLQAIYGIVTAKDCSNFTLEGIAIDGAGVGDHTWEPAGAAFDGVCFRNASGSLIDVDITGVRDPYRTDGTTANGNPVVDGVQHGFGVEVRNDTVLPFTMTGGSIADFQKNAGYFVRADLNITGVTVTGGGAQTMIAQNGFSIYYSTGTVSGNTISGIGYAGPYEAYSGGINAGSNTDLEIVDNTIIGSNGESSNARVVGIWIFQTGGQPIGGGEVSGNEISFTDVGINASGPFGPNAILIEGNTVTDLDLTDPYVYGVNFQPTSSVSASFYAEGSGAADLLAGATSGDRLFGLAGNDELNGNGGDDHLDGGLGADTMTGGLGNDTFIVDDGSDAVVESAGEGTDEVRTGLATYTLGNNLENLTGLSGAAQVLTGNSVGNRILGGTGSDILWGEDGDDVLDGRAGTDTLNGGLGNDILKGAAGDILRGDGGNDTYYVYDGTTTIEEGSAAGTDYVQSYVTHMLADNVENLRLMGDAAINGTGNGMDNLLFGNGSGNQLDGGGGGADTMAGGKGDDVYIVDGGDTVIEYVGGGNDLVMSSVSYTLALEAENLTLTGTADLDGNGNMLANDLTGNSGNNVLDGLAGNDAMDGQGGNDTYFVDSAGDEVIEAASGGTDRVKSYIDYTLGDNVENLSLIGTAVQGTGNGVANQIAGNAEANLLDGGAGADTMQGNLGNDTYVVDNAGDRVVEIDAIGGASDTVLSSVSFKLGSNVENLTLTGGASINGDGNNLDNLLIGNEGANLLRGGGGNDSIGGGLGNDVLQGGAGADGFRFDSALGEGNVDRLADFSVADDTILLDRSVFTEIGADGELDSGAFQLGTAADDAGDRILYDSATGNIFYDADGAGDIAAVLFARVSAGTVLTAADFAGY